MMENKPKESKEFFDEDMKVALMFINHINKPCSDQPGRNIRDFYIKEAKRLLPTIKNKEAAMMLEMTIKEHEKEASSSE